MNIAERNGARTKIMLGKQMKMTRDSCDNNKITMSCKITKVVFSVEWNSVLVGNTDKLNKYHKLKWYSDRETNEANKKILAILLKSQWVVSI